MLYAQESLLKRLTALELTGLIKKFKRLLSSNHWSLMSQPKTINLVVLNLKQLRIDQKLPRNTATNAIC